MSDIWSSGPKDPGARCAHGMPPYMRCLDCEELDRSLQRHKLTVDAIEKLNETLDKIGSMLARDAR